MPSASVVMTLATSPGATWRPSTSTAFSLLLVMEISAPASVASPCATESSRSWSIFPQDMPPNTAFSATSLTTPPLTKSPCAPSESIVMTCTDESVSVYPFGADTSCTVTTP